MQQARGALRGWSPTADLDIDDAARMMAMVSVAYADAIIACFDAKYDYAFWRPITAIRAGDTDGNDATGRPGVVHVAARHAEPPGVSERPLLPHAGGRRCIARFLGTHRINFTVPSLTGLGDRTSNRART